ncbi:hypothetical protein BC833DRAFT_625636 [Globomyces pollinis-pini]|nr:hypothetical protein BC833DRAFT_625636 [Globomyces pollinis-pini]
MKEDFRESLVVEMDTIKKTNDSKLMRFKLSVIYVLTSCLIMIILISTYILCQERIVVESDIYYSDAVGVSEETSIFHGNETAAVMVIGGTRSFASKSVHRSLARYIQSLTNHPDYYFQLSKSEEYSCKTMNLKYPYFSDEKALEYFKGKTRQISWENPSCTEPNIKESSCCQRENNPAHWTSYMRKVSAYNHVRNYEIQHGFEYEWYIFIRPDLYFFEESIATLSSLNTNRIYISSKEKGEPLGDYIYLVPRNFINSFVSLVTHHNDYSCTKGMEPAWPPEYNLDPLIHQQHLPHQLLPILFAILRCDGSADCSRLDNEVLNNLDLLSDGKFMSPKDYCKTVVHSTLLSK